MGITKLFSLLAITMMLTACGGLSALKDEGGGATEALLQSHFRAAVDKEENRPTTPDTVISQMLASLEFQKKQLEGLRGIPELAQNVEKQIALIDELIVKLQSDVQLRVKVEEMMRTEEKKEEKRDEKKEEKKEPQPQDRDKKEEPKRDPRQPEPPKDRPADPNDPNCNDRNKQDPSKQDPNRQEPKRN